MLQDLGPHIVVMWTDGLYSRVLQLLVVQNGWKLQHVMVMLLLKSINIYVVVAKFLLTLRDKNLLQIYYQHVKGTKLIFTLQAHFVDLIVWKLVQIMVTLDHIH